MIYGATNAFNASSSYDLIIVFSSLLYWAHGKHRRRLVAGIMMVTIEDLVSVVWDRCGRILRLPHLGRRTVASSQGLFGSKQYGGLV